MPATRCSSCGRFMNATAGCSNPGCSIPEHVPDSDDRFLGQIIPNTSPPLIAHGTESGPSHFSVDAIIDRSLSSLNSFITEQRILNDDFAGRLEAQDALRGEVDDLSSRLSEAVTKLEGIDEMLHQQFSNKLQDSVAMLTSEHKVLAEGHASLVSDQDELRREHDNLNEVFAEKASALESLRDEVYKLASDLEDQSASSADAIANLGHESNEIYSQLNMVNGKLQEMMAQIVSDEKNLTAKNVELWNNLAQLSHEKEVSNESFTARLEALENLKLRFDELFDKFERQLAVDETAAATFHTMAFDKYKLLESTCDELKTLLESVSSDQKQLVEKTSRLVSEQAGLQNRVAEVEEEQSECCCHELRVKMLQREKEWEEWKRSNDSVVNGQRKLWCQLDTMEEKLEEQKSAICGHPKNQEKNFVDLMRAIAAVLNIELCPEDVTHDAAIFSNGRAEETLLTSAQNSSKQLIKASVLKRQVKNEESVPGVNPRPAHVMKATFVVLVLFVALLAYLLRQVFD